MKSNFSILSLFLLSFFFVSCQNNTSKKSDIAFYSSIDELRTNIGKRKKLSNTRKVPKIVFKDLLDNNNSMIIGQMPFPSDWKWNPKMTQENNYILFSDNGVKVYGESVKMFIYSNDSYLNQMFQQGGQNVQPPKSLNRIITEEFIPFARTQNTELVKQYPLPEMAKHDENYDKYYVFKSVPQQKSFECIATEWVDDKGVYALIIIRYFISYSEHSIFWGYVTNSMEAPKEVFEQAKKDYIYALLNRKYNPKWLQSIYMQDMERARISNEIHAGNMKILKAQGDDIIQRGKEYSNMVDRNHAKYMDGLLDRTTISNNNTGQTYKVDSGSNYYWMNNDGQYISSNDANYNPNTDPNYNNQDWNSTTINN